MTGQPAAVTFFARETHAQARGALLLGLASTPLHGPVQAGLGVRETDWSEFQVAWSCQIACTSAASPASNGRSTSRRVGSVAAENARSVMTGPR
jgi:hypothetical protein